MSRFQKRLDNDIGYVDGMTFITAYPVHVSGATGTRTRSATGNVFTTVPASSSAFINIDFGELDYRFGVQDDLQEFFGGGGSAGSFAGAGGAAVPPGVFSTPGGVSGPPPFTGVTQFTPPSARPKGINITSVTAVYRVNTLATTTNTLAVTKTVFVDGVAPAVTTLLTAQAMSAVAQANPHVVNLALPTPTLYQTAKNAQYMVDWSIVTPATSTVDVYGIMLYYTYNFN